MATETARIHLLAAKSAPVVTILRRKPSKLFHVINWNTQTGELTYGSWFRGKLYPLRCDVSFDGRWMVYLALGSNGDTWNGVCETPWLKTIAEAPNTGTWHGGGYWESSQKLNVNNWKPTERTSALPFKITGYRSDFGEDEGVLYPRLERDGWRRSGPIGDNRDISTPSKYRIQCLNDPGWYWKFSPSHPTLRMIYLGYLDHGRTFSFRLDGHESLLDNPAVSWATWDALGNLVVARAGAIEKFTLADIDRATPSFSRDLENLQPPAVDSSG